MSRILVVEDDTDIASLIVHFLAPAGYESEVVANGSEALAAARRRPPDLVILDCMLPGLDGLEVCRALRADAGLSAVPILMLTARAEEIDRIASAARSRHAAAAAAPRVRRRSANRCPPERDPPPACQTAARIRTG